MELRRGHRSFRPLGEDRPLMLDLNRRLETYLGRVHLLQAENALLAEEIRALRRSDRGALEEGVRRLRLEVDAAWREKVHAEREAGRAAEEIQALELQRQEEARARAEARRKLEQSRKELEGEQWAHVWLREKVGELEQEIKHLIGSHREDVAALTKSRATRAPTWPQRGTQAPHLLQLGQEYSQRATRAWQESAEAHRGLFSRLEDSLSEARGRLTRVGREKSESQLKLRALEEEMASARDARRLLETTAAQQAEGHRQEIQHLQELSAGLQAEKEELDHQMELLLLESRGLQQQQTSLGLEVVTYRALLPSDGLGGGVPLLNQPRRFSITDSWGVKTNEKTRLSAGHRTTSLPSVWGSTGRGPPATLADPQGTTWKPQPWQTAYPKILQDGAVESFRPQEVHEEVTYAEALSPPIEQEAETTAGAAEGDEESGLGTQPRLGDTTPNITPYPVRMREDSCGFSDESDGDPPAERPSGKEEVEEMRAETSAWPREEFTGGGGEPVQEETSDVETEAVTGPNSDSRTSRPVSEPEESFCPTENIWKDDAAEMRQQTSCSMDRNHGAEVEDKLYPDGEEMDTWDSVTEGKVDLKTEKNTTNDEEKGQRAEPEEDISARDQKHEKTGIGSDSVRQYNEASSKTHTQVDGEQRSLLPDNQRGDDEDDSENVSVSWRTELESDSYAQDNTLADTTPLIRYESDGADATTQASRVGEGDSSEGEEERKPGGTAMWSEGKSKTFGTMEDLCEEVEGESLHEDYDLGSAPIGGHGETLTEPPTLVSAGETVRKVSEGRSDAETEELTKSTTSTDMCSDEETDRLVEQELENIATENYRAHFAQQQLSGSEEMLHRQGRSIEEKTEQEEAGMPGSAEPDASVHRQPAPSTTFTDPPCENLYLWDSLVGITLPCAPVQEEDRSAPMATHADATEDHPSFTDLISGPEGIHLSEDPKPVLQVTADPAHLQDVAAPARVKEAQPAEASSVSHEHRVEGVTDHQEFQEAPEAAEWEVLEDFRSSDQKSEGRL